MMVEQTDFPYVEEDVPAEEEAPPPDAYSPFGPGPDDGTGTEDECDV